MINEKFDFYSPSNIDFKDLDKDLLNSLSVVNKLDDSTTLHCINVSNLCTRVCQYMRCNTQFTVHCMIAGYIHDIGNLFIPKEIVQKPGPLTEAEFEIMKTHTTRGYEYCMNDPNLRPYSDGPLYHHESLNGTGYPQGLKKKDIPYSAQIIKVCDIYDALVAKRNYKTHVDISKTLKELITFTKPTKSIIALDNLRQKEKYGSINPRPLKALFNVVIDDILYEISCVMNYVDYLSSNIRRLENIKKYHDKYNSATDPSKKDYYLAGINLLLSDTETLKNYQRILYEYKEAYKVRKERINNLYKEIKIIKRLKFWL